MNSVFVGGGVEEDGLRLCACKVVAATERKGGLGWFLLGQPFSLWCAKVVSRCFRDGGRLVDLMLRKVG